MMKTSRILSGLFLVLCIILAASHELHAVIQDTTPPGLIGFDAEPDTINTYTGLQTVRLTLQITDDLSGFNCGSLVLSSPSGNQSMAASINNDHNAPTGTYEVAVTFPQFSETGLWRVTSINLKDYANNIGYPDTNTLEGIQVVSIAPDTIPPVLIDLSFAPHAVNVYSGSRTATASLHITDNLSGFKRGEMVLSSPTGTENINVSMASGQMITGNANDGIYECTITFPQSSETGIWRVTSMSIEDEANNTGYPDLNGLEGIEVVSTASDTIPPEVRHLEVITHMINTNEGPKPAIFALHITDDLSGFSSGSISMSSPSGRQTISGILDSSQLVSGDAMDGIYKLTLTVPQSSETGIWHIKSLQVKDAANNTGFPDPSGFDGIEIVSEKDCYVLNASVVGGHGTVSPTSGVYYRGRVVALLATPDAGYCVKAWVGTADDSTKAIKNSVILDTDRIVTVEFELISEAEENDDQKHGDSCFILASRPDDPHAQLAFVLIFMILIFSGIFPSVKRLRRH